MDAKYRIILDLRRKLDAGDRKIERLTRMVELERSLWQSESTQDRKSVRNPVTLNRIEFLDSVYGTPGGCVTWPTRTR